MDFVSDVIGVLSKIDRRRPTTSGRAMFLEL